MTIQKSINIAIKSKILKEINKKAWRNYKISIIKKEAMEAEELLNNL